MTTLSVHPTGPFDLRATIDPSRAGGAPCARDWRQCGSRIVLGFPLDGSYQPAAVAVTQAADGSVEAELAGTDDVAAASRQLARILSIDHDGSGLLAVAERDPIAARVILASPGRRPINFQSPYHKAVWGVLCQGISMRVAGLLQARIIEAVGGRVEIAGRTVGTLPHPDRLLALGDGDIQGVGGERLLRGHAVAQAALDGRLDADRLRGLPLAEAVADLRRIRGVGPWTAKGIVVRGAAPADATAEEEPRVLAEIGSAYSLGRPATAAEYLDIAKAWRPYRMWLTYLFRATALPAAAAVAG